MQTIARHIAFGTPNFSDALATLASSANGFNLEFVAYGVEHPAVMAAIAENKSIAGQRRGAGYWIWKPYILLHAMDHMEDGGLLLYTDAGADYIAHPGPLLRMCDDRDIVLFNTMRADYTQRAYCKRDTYILLDADSPRFWDRRQVQGGIQLYRVGDTARDFVAAWRDAMRVPDVLTDSPNRMGKPNFSEFIEHRHDQAVLTIVAEKTGIETFRSPARAPVADEPGDYPQIFSLHKSRNPSLQRHVALLDDDPARAS